MSAETIKQSSTGLFRILAASAALAPNEAHSRGLKKAWNCAGLERVPRRRWHNAKLIFGSEK
jgi:hypothetical protein